MILLGFRKLVDKLLCSHGWVEVSRRVFPDEGVLLSEQCVLCRARRWRMDD